MDEYAGLFRSIRPSLLLTACKDGGGRQDTTTLSISFRWTLLSGGCDGLLLGMADLCRSAPPAPAVFLLVIIGLLSLPLLLLLSSDSLLRLMLVLALVFLSKPVPLFCVFASVVLVFCGAVSVLSGVSVSPWVKDVGLEASFSPSRSPSVGEDTLLPPDLYLVAFILLGRRGEL